MATSIPPAATADVGPGIYPGHWGPNPYLKVPSSNPYYRSLAVVDNTGSAVMSHWIQGVVASINNLHNSYSPNYPVLLYYQNLFLGKQGEPCANPAKQFLVICHEPGLPSPNVSAITPGTAAPANHLTTIVLRFSTFVLNDVCEGDRFSLIVKELGKALGLDLNGDPNSALNANRDPIGGCRYLGFTATDLNRLNQIYSHAA